MKIDLLKLTQHGMWMWVSLGLVEKFGVNGILWWVLLKSIGNQKTEKT